MTLEKYALSKELRVIICKLSLSYNFQVTGKQKDNAIYFI